jgi:dipeptidyl aminopeptidase/acylaminoacyl peptidase
MIVARARIGRRSASSVVEGDTQVSGFSPFQDRGRRLLAYTAAWVDTPGDVFVRALDDTSVTPTRISRASDELLAVVELTATRRRRVKSRDGLEIEYFEMTPKRTSPGRRNGKTPLYLEIHGGPHGWNPLFLLFPYYQTLVAAGYTVILPNPRGSTSYAEDFALAVNGDWGGEDYHDLMACVGDALRRGRIDERRLFVGGYSYGGYMSSFIIGQTDRFKAAIIGAPVTNLSSEYGSSDVGAWLAETVGGDPWRATALYQERSPITHARKITTPVLLHVSDGDLRTPPSQSDEFYTALKLMGKTVEYVRYPGGSHQAVGPFGAPPSQNEDRLWRILDFLGRHGGNRVRGAKS